MIDPSEVNSLTVLMRKFKELVAEHNGLLEDVAALKEQVKRRPGRPPNAERSGLTSGD